MATDTCISIDTTETMAPRLRSRWGAIAAGAIAAMAIQVTLTVLGLALGLSLWGSDGRTAGEAIGIGAGVWWFLTGLCSLFIGGLIAGYLSPTASSCLRSIHGFLVWGLINVLSAAIVAISGTATAANLGGTTALMYPEYSYNVPAAGDSATVPGGSSFNQSGLTSDQAAEAAAATAWWLLAALILGAGAATLGGLIAGRMPDPALVISRPGPVATVPSAVAMPLR